MLPSLARRALAANHGLFHSSGGSMRPMLPKIRPQTVDLTAIASGTTAGVSIMATAFATSSIVAALKNGELGRYSIDADDYWIAYCVLS
ncbi:hypothetical protein CYLTODRAFT_449687 [Cylindrobasidium torrendii FP15055 ss-10]|uniref:Uncharacterized protein n=1 Tax=Cylindrobasidium torrendii FP15055 ss-10 TaxID=1314674 RepID=A0A0D7BQM8_9AGAR|nr:hypothetical protein CYLTODRAFT_449687 [Cylindrobasidium torrendii FP15055 ss-10]